MTAGSGSQDQGSPSSAKAGVPSCTCPAGCKALTLRVPCREREAWREEFWPPGCADSVLLLVGHLARKAAWLGSEALRSRYAAAVPKVHLASFSGPAEAMR